MSAPRASDLCDQWAIVASEEHGVPATLMRAITLVETGRDLAGHPAAWPWAIHADGAGHWFGSRHEAEAFLERRIAEGMQNVDIGCFQINYQWHGAAFAAPGDMLDPARNARYAARFLAALHRELGDWTRATAAYHSRTAELGRAYVSRVASVLRAGAGGGAPPAIAATPRDRTRGARAALPFARTAMPAAPGAPTGWTRAPASAGPTGAPLGSLMPRPATGHGPGSAPMPSPSVAAAASPHP